MRFLIDAQLPPALVRFLRDVGHPCDHVSQLAMLPADDSLIWNHADRTQSVIITKDEDFPTRRMLGDAGPAIVWLRVGNCSNRALLQWFKPMLPEIIARLKAGEILIEVI
jgi:predicted nuclease of predicted toxin-antitoxin system